MSLGAHVSGPSVGCWEADEASGSAMLTVHCTTFYSLAGGGVHCGQGEGLQTNQVQP